MLKGNINVTLHNLPRKCDKNECRICHFQMLMRRVFINSTTITRLSGVVVYLIASNLHNFCDKLDAIMVEVKDILRLILIIYTI